MLKLKKKLGFTTYLTWYKRNGIAHFSMSFSPLWKLFEKEVYIKLKLQKEFKKSSKTKQKLYDKYLNQGPIKATLATKMPKNQI